LLEANAAAVLGGAVFLKPIAGVEQKTVWVNCDYFNNKVVGLAAQPGGGGAVSAYNGGWGWFYMCKFVKNTAETHLAMGGMLFAYDSATLFFRDCIVAENIGYSGGAVRVYATQLVAGFQILFDRCIFSKNSAALNGAILSAFTHSRAHLVQFVYDGHEIVLTGVPFDPNEVFERATIDVEAGRTFGKMHTLRHMTDMSIVHLPGGMSIGSGGTAFFDGNGWTLFRDCYYQHNVPDNQAACYFDQDLDAFQCFTSKRIE